MRDNSIQVLVLSTAALFVLITGFIVYFIILYRNKQLINAREQEKLYANFKQELLKAKIEIQEQTLNHISREIHDNINQVLSFVKLNLGMIDIGDELVLTKINENRELISQSINDLRRLSKSLSLEHITSMGLIKTIELDIKRLNISGLIKANIIIQGKKYQLGEQYELVLFRIFQEALNNTLKHAAAKHLEISLQYLPELFKLTLKDDGKGFAPQTLSSKSGSGLRNIQNRAALIGAEANIDSKPGNGTTIDVILNPLKLRLYTDGTYPNSIS